MEEGLEQAVQLAHLLKTEGIHNKAVLRAIASVPRHLFVDEGFQSQAYHNEALPILGGQTISQPYVVARMTEILLGDGHLSNVLEVGTGSGYQAAILSHLVDEVYTIERIKLLYELATQRINQLDYANISILHGDGYLGWPEHAPYDGIIVTAAPPEVPKPLLEQLADGGRMIIPIGAQFQAQQLCLVTRHQDTFEKQFLDPVIFVPMLHDKSDE